MPRHRACEKCGGHGNDHPVRHIEWDRWSACVDEDVAPLVLACWQASIGTTECCQDFGLNRGSGCQEVFLSFDGIDDYATFARAVLGNGPRDGYYARVQGFHLDMDSVESPWEWSCEPCELDRDFYDSEAVVPSFSVDVVFPHMDLVETERRIRGIA